ncbi:conserved hypothetical protein [Histoplasma mississippiense (nom. inval.)]|uniref:conserved hypothetical protein n=1 Tax=Ajellomyces capsulatus (strain NAm1 / WU24) TaxID=2059318 RepID=UPI000157B316|nr:conserved hypothetical protein [Histoplasma mississippiense (nom. inval.)]EDN02204.1 conserved hypothetical protein [Histoplasma mississippiense (nom. inval.)]
MFSVPRSIADDGNSEFQEAALYIKHAEDNRQSHRGLLERRVRMVLVCLDEPIPGDIHPSTVRKLDNFLEIEWANDGHTSTYSYSWLSEHHLKQRGKSDIVRFGYSRPSYNLCSYKFLIINIGARAEKQSVSNDPNTYPTVLYDEVMLSDDGVRKWTDQIYRWGFSFVKGCPATPEATEKLLERIAFIRPTHYGGFWDFTSDLSLKDMAYTTEGLGGHTDTTYFTDPAGLQMFHMLSHTNGSGGESLLVDGFEAAKTLYNEDPEAYEVLKEFGVDGHASGNEHYSTTGECSMVGLHFRESGGYVVAT